MINNNRLVPVMATDLLTLYGTILKIANVSVSALKASSIGEFNLTTAASGAQICDEPVKKLNFDTGVSSATVYFIPALDYEGFSIEGVDVTPTGTVDADGSTLYTATLATGAVTIAKVGF